MDAVKFLFGDGPNLTMLQMCTRTFATFILMLILIRASGMRTFAKRSPFDTIITIMLGAVLARGVVGASDYIDTVVASVVMVAMHRTLAWFSVKNKRFEKLIKGRSITLYHDGALIDNNLEKSGMSENDLHESLRLETKKLTLDDVDTAFMETNGRISFILKEKEKS